MNLIAPLGSKFFDVAYIGPGVSICPTDGKSEPETDRTTSKQSIYGHPEARDIFMVVDVPNSSLDFDSTTNLSKHGMSTRGIAK